MPRYLLLLSLLSLSAIAYSQKWKELPEEKINGKITWHKLADEKDAPSYAMLYFYREYTPPLITPLKKMSVFVNDTLRYELKGNSMVSLKVYKKGQYKISGDKKDNTAMFVKIELGKEYFFNCFMPADIFSSMSVTAIKPDVARRQLGMPANDSSQKNNYAANTEVFKDTLYNANEKPASFPGGAAAWMEYLEKNLKTRLIKKYVSIERNETYTTRIAQVIFTIDANGYVVEPVVINSNELHPKLAEEAIRLIKASPKWIPATQNGRNVEFKAQQDISFEKYWQ